MATTSVTANLVPSLWAKQLWKDVQDEMFWTTHGFVGEGPSFPIQKLTQLKKEPGDTIKFGLTVKLSGAGKTGDDTLEGYEEAITSYDESVTVNQIRNAVRLAGKFEEQQACYDMRADAKEKLKIWYPGILYRGIWYTGISYLEIPYLEILNLRILYPGIPYPEIWNGGAFCRTVLYPAICFFPEKRGRSVLPTKIP